MFLKFQILKIHSKILNITNHLNGQKLFDDAKITDLTGFLENTKINHWSLKKYDCRFQHLNGFDKIFGESLPVNSLANISPVAKFNYGSITNDPCSNTEI